MWPSPLHSSKFAHMVHVQVLLPYGWTAMSLTLRMHVFASMWKWRVSVWACGQISCHSGAACVTGGVVSLTRNGIQWDAVTDSCISPGIGGVQVDVGCSDSWCGWYYICKCRCQTGLVGIHEMVCMAMIAWVSVPLGSFASEEDEGVRAHMPGPVVVCCILVCPHAKWGL